MFVIYSAFNFVNCPDLKIQSILSIFNPPISIRYDVKVTSVNRIWIGYVLQQEELYLFNVNFTKNISTFNLFGYNTVSSRLEIVSLSLIVDLSNDLSNEGFPATTTA